MTTSLEERAREFLCVYLDMLDGLGTTKVNRDVHYAKLTDLLTLVQAEARLEEAKWWDSHDDDTEADATAKVSRLVTLAQAAAPAKETKVVPTIEEMSGLLSKDCAEQIKKDINK